MSARDRAQVRGLPPLGLRAPGPPAPPPPPPAPPPAASPRSAGQPRSSPSRPAARTGCNSRWFALSDAAGTSCTSEMRHQEKRISDSSNGLGERVARLRRSRRLTQEELAERAGVSVELVRKLEQGRRRSVRLGTVQS